MKKFVLSLVLFVVLTNIGYSQDLEFAAMCDSRGSNDGVNEKVLTALTNHMIKNNPGVKFLVFPGDLIDGSKTEPQKTFKQLQHWKEVMAPVYNNPNMVRPWIWPLVGNHEIRNRHDEENYHKLFPDVVMNGPDDEKGLTYSFDYNDVHFVFINTNRFYYGNLKDTTDDRVDWHYIKHLDWLEKDLEAAKKRNVKHIFVMGHEAAFPIGGHLRDALPNLGTNLVLPLDSTRQWFLNQRNKFWQLLSDNKVAAYICGHEHLYGRESYKGVFQIVVGSSGAPVYYFNSKYGDNPAVKKNGQELTYNEALPYYKILGYDYSPEGNAQVSKDFVGYRAFEYVVVSIKGDKVSVKTFGAFPKEGTTTELGTEVKLIDEFVIR